MKKRRSKNSIWTELTLWSFFIPNASFFILALGLTGCGIVKDKYKMNFSTAKNGTPADEGVEIVATENINGGEAGATSGVRGRIQSPSSKLQMIKGPDGTTISNASVSFPPGSLNIDTDVTLEIGPEISTEQDLRDRGLNGVATSRSPSLQISTPTPMNAITPFVLALPHPGTPAQLMQGTGTLLVIYETQPAGSEKPIRSYFKREQLKVNDQDIRIESIHFGVFQAIYFVATDSKPVLAKSILYQPGMTILSFGGNRARAVNHFVGWGSFIAPFKVEAGGFLSTGIITRAILP